MATSSIPNPNVVGNIRVATAATGNGTTFTLELANAATQALWLMLSSRYPTSSGTYRSPTIYSLVYRSDDNLIVVTQVSAASGTPITITAAQDANNPRKITITTANKFCDAVIIGTNPFTVS